jgi:hypothetical protein
VIDDRHANERLLGGDRDAGLQELRSVAGAGCVDTDAEPADLARVLVDLSYQLRIDNVTGKYHAESFAECEAILAEAKSVLSASSERPDGWAWLTWHTALRGLFILQDRWDAAVDATDRKLSRIREFDDADGLTIQRLQGWRAIDSDNAEQRHRVGSPT